MWMVIGGAETHVVELSRELAACGHDVTVASNGGVYVDALIRGGVKHFTVPLHTKSPSAMIKSYKALKKLIEQEKFDIVHAHSRIPAFICGALAKRMGFRFVTSTHAVFKVNPMLARLSDWGDHTFAVSCDIKQYLIDNYKTPSDNITLTINGIDTERFSSSADPSRIINELSLSRDAFRAVYVSRIDNETAMPGFLLCEAAEELCRSIPNLEIVIVGGGTAYDELYRRAEAANTAIGHQVVRLIGPRTDIDEICASADVFVGVSRAALEAMSMEKPVILAGQQGYIGVLDETAMPKAKLTNFTCRGERMPDAKLIADDIRTVYGMSEEKRSELGALGRREVLAGYSVSRMANDHITVYKKLTPYRRYKHGDIIISGYYGFENIGDDSLLTSIIDGIRTHSPSAKITVLAKHPTRLARITGVRTINRFNIPRVALEMRHAKLLISGGGSLLQDGTSKKSLYYYVSIMRMAKHFGLKLMLYANGLGPLTSESSRKAAAAIIAEADHVSLREEASLALARELGTSGGIRVTADPAFLLEPAHELWKRHIMGREGINGGYFIVSIKDGNNFDGADTDKSAISVMAGDISAIAEKYSLTPLFVPMFPDRDAEITEALAKECGMGKLISGLTASELCAIMSDAKFVIGTRLHMLIFAASVGVPMLGISYDPKIDAFLDYIGESERTLDIRTLSAGQLSSAADGIMENADEIKKRLSVISAELKQKAEADRVTAAQLLK